MDNKKKTPSPQGSPEKLSMPIITPDNVDVLPSFEQVKAQVDQECEPLFEKLLLLIVCKTLGNPKGLTLHQQSDFNTPWGKAPGSKEEEAFQDLIWLHKVLPPHDKFNTELAAKGYYTKLRWQKLDEFWSECDLAQDKQINYRQTYKPLEYPEKNTPIKKIQVKPPTFRHRGQANV